MPKTLLWSLDNVYDKMDRFPCFYELLESSTANGYTGPIPNMAINNQTDIRLPFNGYFDVAEPRDKTDDWRKYEWFEMVWWTYTASSTLQSVSNGGQFKVTKVYNHYGPTQEPNHIVPTTGGRGLITFDCVNSTAGYNSGPIIAASVCNVYLTDWSQWYEWNSQQTTPITSQYIFQWRNTGFETIMGSTTALSGGADGNVVSWRQGNGATQGGYAFNIPVWLWGGWD